MAMDERSQRTEVTQELVIMGLLYETKPETDDGEKADTTPASRVSAWTTLARHLGMLTDNTNLGANSSLKEILAEISGERMGLPPPIPDE
jgi:hypothetical protein